MKTKPLNSPRLFEFAGFFGKPYYGGGKFTVGKVYQTMTMRFGDSEDIKPALPEAVFEDDDGRMKTEELIYFKEIFDEN